MPINNGLNLQTRRQLVALLRTNRALAVTGAGVSWWAGYKTWTGVLQALAVAVGENSRGAIPDPQIIIQNNPDPLHCARELGMHLGPRFANFIQNEFAPTGNAPHDVLYRIVSLPFIQFLTLNFDTSAERVHEAMGRQCRGISTTNHPELITFLRDLDLPSYGRKVVHLHGLYSEPLSGT